MYKLLLTIVTFSFSFSAHAVPVDVNFSGLNTVVSSKVQVTGSPFGINAVSMGSYNLHEAGVSNAIIGFCVDPFQWASASVHSYDKSSLDASDFSTDGAARYNNVQKLFDNAYSTLGTDAGKTAGFHLALWEIFHDDLNLNSGIIQGLTSSNLSMLSSANTFLGALAGWNVSNQWDITFYNNDQYQNYVTATPSAVPVPAALPLFLSGLAGLGFMRRLKTDA